MSEDTWTLWFWRLVQILGAGGFVHELLLSPSERKWILATCLAMMLGGYGVTRLLRVFTRDPK